MNAQEWDDLVGTVYEALDHYDHPCVDRGDVSGVLAAYVRVTGVDLADAPTLADQEAAAAARKAAVSKKARRIVLSAVESMETYRRGATSVLSEPARSMVNRVIEHCIDMVQSSAYLWPVDPAQATDQRINKLPAGTGATSPPAGKNDLEGPRP